MVCCQHDRDLLGVQLCNILELELLGILFLYCSPDPFFYLFLTRIFLMTKLTKGTSSKNMDSISMQVSLV